MTTRGHHAADPGPEGTAGDQSLSDMMSWSPDELPTFRVAALEGSTTVGLVAGGDATLPARVARFLERVSENIEGGPAEKPGRALHVPRD
jgi:hypothetical protein